MPNIELKSQLVSEIAEKLKNSPSTIVVDYRGLNVDEVTNLRKQARDAGVEYKVYKNTMVRRALEQAGIEGMEEYFTGPTAVAFAAEDAVTPAKILNDFTKDHKNLEIKAGLVDGKVVDTAGVVQLAKLPSKEVLIAQVLGGLNAPITGFVGVLNANLRGLAVALGQIAEQKAAAEAQA
ncbi:MAG: 50S ribosomal protein L10 [Eubacteriaceae bacterium]|jgi:large subunit ribosomal protein L10